MSNEHADPLPGLAARTRELETRYTHLHRIVDDLNDVVIDQGKKLDVLERQVAALARQLGSLSERAQEPRSLEDDKPPHY